MGDEITNTQDIIDSRDVIARIEELQDEAQGLEDAVSAAKEAIEEFEAEATEELTNALEEAEAALVAFAESDEAAELKKLLALQDESEGYSDDWQHGSQLIRDSYFKEYAQEFADEIGAIDRNASWPLSCIDWDQAADELKQDYTSVDFGGVEYWVR